MSLSAHISLLGVFNPPIPRVRPVTMEDLLPSNVKIPKSG